MKTRIVGLFFALLVATASQAGADPITVTFDRDTLGLKANGFTSVDSNLVSFSDANPADLGPQIILENLNGNGTTDLAFYGTGALLMRFAVPVTSLSLQFGNDDPTVARPGDLAVLSTLLDGRPIATSSVAFNLNDLLDQTIGVSGQRFDEALFVFASGQTGAPIPFLAEVIDNVTFAPTPEPASLLLLGTGIIGVVARRWRKRPANVDD